MIMEIIRDYEVISNSVDKIIKKSGYKIGYLQEQMGMDNVSFYNKRKHGKFSTGELMRLMNIIKVEELEDKILGEMSLEAEKETETIRLHG